MKLIVVIFISISFFYCSRKNNYSNPKTKNKINDSSLINQADSIIRFYDEKYPEMPLLKHELIDVNYDNTNDLILYFEGVGTGVLNKVKVFTFSKIENKFFNEETLSKLENPSFYLDSSLITSFYIGLGGGYALRMKWNNSNWDTLEYFIINPSKIKTPKWDVTRIDYFNNDTTVFTTNSNDQIPDKSWFLTKYNEIK